VAAPMGAMTFVSTADRDIDGSLLTQGRTPL
jgi:hypothetical protein